jgi:xylulokinase
VAYLGIDLGTGGIKCVLIRVDGSVIFEVSRSLPCLNRSTKAGESEQDALDWIRCLEDAFDELFSVPNHRRVLAVAIDSTSATILPVNEEGHPLGHAFLHNDVRAIDEAKECRSLFGGECSPTFALPKILWMQRRLHLPDNVRFVHATDFLNVWLSGSIEIPTDFTNAMKTGVDLETKDWLQGLPSINLPSIVAPGHLIGEISLVHKQRWGLSGSCLLVSGATDSNAAFYASGAGRVGEWSTTIGTTLAVKGLSKNRIIDRLGRIYCHRHPDGSWLPGGASNAGGEILKDRLGERLQTLENKTISLPQHPPLFYPSIRQGERLPFTNPKFKPFGVSGAVGKSEFFIGCLEGLAFVELMVYQLLEKLEAEVGPFVFATGGAAKSKMGLHIRAEMLQRTILIPQYPNSAMGAAILAIAGHTSRTVGEISGEVVRIVTEVDPPSMPDPARQDRFERFCQLCHEGSNQSE